MRTSLEKVRLQCFCGYLRISNDSVIRFSRNLAKRPMTPIWRKNRLYFNSLIWSNIKEITLAHSLTSVQNKQEINVNRTCKSAKTYFLTAKKLTSWLTLAMLWVQTSLHLVKVLPYRPLAQLIRTCAICTLGNQLNR